MPFLSLQQSLVRSIGPQCEMYEMYQCLFSLHICLCGCSCSGGKQKTTQEYFSGNFALRTIPVTVSIFMSYVSAVLILGEKLSSFFLQRTFVSGCVLNSPVTGCFTSRSNREHGRDVSVRRAVLVGVGRQHARLHLQRHRLHAVFSQNVPHQFLRGKYT